MIISKIKGYRGASINLALLFFGKISGILINLVFIPFYSRILGEYAFGIVATILSLQVMLIMLDLGFSTYLGRQAAAQEAKNHVLDDLASAESILLVIYILAAIFSLLASLLGILENNDFVVFFSILLFLSLILQNIYYVIICAKKQYSYASIILTVGNLSRAIVTVIVLKWVSSSLVSFVLSQLCMAFMHMVFSRYYAFKFIGNADHFKRFLFTIKGGAALIGKTYSLAIFSIAGALVTQLDKPIITYFINAKAVGAYFLAMTICMVPIGLLAGPVTQYFQPRIISLVTDEEKHEIQVVASTFLYILTSIIFFPCILLWLFRDELIKLWLGDVSYLNNISVYVKLMLPSLAVGALGFFPYSLLLAAKDYKFQARLSVLLAAVTIPFVIFAAIRESILLVCVTYSFYHMLSTGLSWWRACYVESVSLIAIKKVNFIIIPTLVAFFNIALVFI